jgi:hypothetical protein
MGSLVLPGIDAGESGIWASFPRNPVSGARFCSQDLRERNVDENENGSVRQPPGEIKGDEHESS